MSIKFHIVVATDDHQGIGKRGKLPWHLPGDLKYFKNLTTKTEDAGNKNVVIMGRKTWESIPKKHRPLPGRINIILTRNKNFELPNDVYRAGSFDEILTLLDSKSLKEQIERIFVIGGAQIYTETLKREDCGHLYITEIQNSFDCDTRFPDYRADFSRLHQSEAHHDGEMTYYFSEYGKNSR